MKKVLITILCIIFVMMVNAQTFNQSVQLNLQMVADTTLHPFNGNPTTSIGISGHITFTSELGFVRFVVNDNYDDEYMIYESYRLFENDSSFNFSQKCEESCFFESYVPTELIVQIKDAIVTISTIELSNSVYSNSEFLRQNAAENTNAQKLIKVQNYIQNNGLIWVAGSTQLSSLSYKQKASIFGDGFKTYGYEFYSKGFFSVFGPDRYSSSKNFVCNFDWRNRHRANSPQSSYYDGDALGTGWITPVVCQSEGCWINGGFDCYLNAQQCQQLGGDYREASTCWIFGPTAQVEALTNLYYNKHLDVDLSEQYIACKEQSIGGGDPINTMEYYKNVGVPLESCLPYSASLGNCEDLCADSLVRVSIYNYSSYNQNAMTDLLLKQYLINKGPLTVSGLPLGFGMNHHCMALVGWGTIDDDIVREVLGVPHDEHGNYDNDFLGLTYWIYKESIGTDEGDNGFKYILHINNEAPSNTFSISSPILYDNLTEQDIRCCDLDGDGYYNWGIGPKPAHCPPCPDEPDGDDSNPNLGPLNSYGQCTIIGTYSASFEDGWDNWMQVDIPNHENGIFWRYNLPSSSSLTGPTYAQDGDYYIYINTREMINYNGVMSVIESPDINIQNTCNNVLDFYYHMKVYDWNSGTDKPRIMLRFQKTDDSWYTYNKWYEVGDHGSEWQHASIVLSPDVKKVRIYIQTGTYQYSDIAFDNITIGPWNHDENPIVVNDTVVWDDNMTINQDVIIENGGHLTIRKNGGNNAIIGFHSDAKIIVKPGGRLILDHCTLTNRCSNEMWQGIEVWGNSSTHQHEVNGSFGQGYIELKNGAIIENAKCAVELWHPGIYSTTGGIIHATDATFRNNAKAAHALWYSNVDGGREGDYNGYFRNCTFTVDDDYIGTKTFYKHVDLAHVKGFDFWGCDFSAKRSVDSVSSYCMGIGAYEAGFRVDSYCSNANVTPCPDEDWVHSSFNGFYRGIQASNDGSSARAFSVRHSEFANNTCGIYMLNTGYGTIVDNEFVVGCGSDCDFGIYADGVSGFCIEDNTFRPKATNIGSPYGIMVVNSEGANDIYNNDFINLRCGNVAVGVNTVTASSPNAPIAGLTYTCNTNTGNLVDFCVLKDGNVGAIAPQQGSTTKPAGNTFSGSLYQFYNDGTQWIEYHYDSNGLGQIPSNSLLHRVSTHGTQSSNNCMSHYGGGGSVSKTASEKAALMADYHSARSTYASLQQLYDSRIDGGSTPTQVADINSAMPSDMWNLRAQLLGISPYVSGEVLTTAAERCDVFSDPVLFEILAANPDELKKDSLITYLENKEHPLPAYMTNLLRQIASGFTARTALLAQMAQYNHAYSLAAGDIVRSSLNDSVTDPTELRTWLCNMEDLASDRMIVTSYLQEGDSVHAFNLASMLPELYGLQGDALADHLDYMSLIGLYQTLNREGRTVFELTDTEAAMVDGVALFGTGTSKAMAEAILMQRSDKNITTHSCPTMPENEGGDRGRSGYTETSFNEAMGFTVSVSPNPASTWATVSYSLPVKATLATIRFTNTLGVTVANYDLPGNEAQKVLDLRNLSDGVYLYTIQCGEYTNTGKLIIKR